MYSLIHGCYRVGPGLFRVVFSLPGDETTRRRDERCRREPGPSDASAAVHLPVDRTVHSAAAGASPRPAQSAVHNAYSASGALLVLRAGGPSGHAGTVRPVLSELRRVGAALAADGRLPLLHEALRRQRGILLYCTALY